MLEIQLDWWGDYCLSFVEDNFVDENYIEDTFVNENYVEDNFVIENYDEDNFVDENEEKEGWKVIDWIGRHWTTST